jgi:hypothetical protein
MEPTRIDNQILGRRLKSMAIYRLLRHTAFDPEMIACMTEAYEGALRVLRLANREDPLTEIIAKKIVELAQLGELDPVRLRTRTLDELGIEPETSG